MSKKLKEVLENVLSMPYFKNDHAQGGEKFSRHEDAVAERLKGGGFNEILASNFPKLSKNVLKKWADGGDETALRNAIAGMKEGEFISQPGGSQAFPDFLVMDFEGGKLYAVECKSTKKGVAPMWNDNLPKPNGIYVFSSGSLNKTTVFLGKDVIAIEIVENTKKMLADFDEIVKKYNEQNKLLDKHGRGWYPDFRPQNFQHGAGSNYFSHSQKSECEQNVLTYVAQTNQPEQLVLDIL